MQPPQAAAVPGTGDQCAPSAGVCGIAYLFAALIVVVGLGFVDYATGRDLRLYPLYMIPIAAIAWRNGMWHGVAVSIASVATWIVSKRLAGIEVAPVVWVINGLAHLVAFSFVVVLIESLRRSYGEECRLARVDDLTSLPNSRAFVEMAAAEIERQKRYGHRMTIAFADLDNFKAVNDTYGHNTGDSLLSMVAQAMRSSTRGTDILGRIGGDEFVILMPETDVEGARQVLERFRDTVRDIVARRQWPVTCSVGAVTFVQPPDSVDDLLGRADALMYSVKESGKNAVRVVCFSRDDGPED